LSSGLAAGDAANADAYIAGSASTGYSYGDHIPFDEGRVSDYDVALVSPALLQRAAALGLDLRTGRTRTGPLSEWQLRQLGLGGLAARLSSLTGRAVHFMIYQSFSGLLEREPLAIRVPR
jgi:filamentous hemagglutinin